MADELDLRALARESVSWLLGDVEQPAPTVDPPVDEALPGPGQETDRSRGVSEPDH